MRPIGKAPSVHNPTVCSSCFTFLASHHGGAEIEVTMLFADIRGSTALAETMSPVAFRDLMDRFYTVATAVVFDHDGTVDKFVGDELIATFIPLLSGDDHAKHGVAAAMALLRATGHADPDGPWVPIGGGLHTATTWFGAVGHGSHVELTAVGDPMNTTARLASVAAAGEILVTMPRRRRPASTPGSRAGTSNSRASNSPRRSSAFGYAALSAASQPPDLQMPGGSPEGTWPA